MSKEKNKTVNIDNENFQTILICAVRYSLGRMTYMPHLVIDYITPLLSSLSEKTLGVLKRDIGEADKMGFGYGDEKIDKPKWMQFYQQIASEIERRKGIK